MPNWKKVIVSGSDAHLKEVTSSGGISLGDDVFLNLGDADDLQLYHDGSNSYIKDNGTGNIFYRSGTQTFQNAAGSKTMAVFNAANSVDLNFNNTQKFQTTNTGINVTGSIVLTGNIVGKSDGTTEIGDYSDGAIKIIRMVQGGEIHFGDTTTSNFFGITEGTANSFGDSDTMGIYYRNGLNIYSANNTQRLKVHANGRVGINTTADAGFLLDVNGTSRLTGNVTLQADISGSSATTASFARIEATTISASRVDVDAGTLAIGGTSITKTVADNIQDTSGTNTGDITLAGGSKDFIQLTNQVVTVNQVDLTDDVTGVLPSANLDSDTAHLTTTQTFSGIKTFSAPITASAGVSGSASSTGSFGKVSIGSTGLAQSGSELFEVKGNLGTLFTITDEMSGSIFSANTIAGIPVIEAFSDQTVRLGPLANQVEVGLGGHITSSANISSSATLIGANISSSGDIVADGDVVAYNSSDMRLKNNLKVIEGALDKIDGIAGYEFDWNDNSPGWARERGHDVGVVAQEIEKIHPEIVEERKNGYLGVDYKRLVPLLIQSIKELKQEVEELKKKV